MIEIKIIIFSIFLMTFGLFTVVTFYQLRNQGSIGQPIRDLYKMNLFLFMPSYTILSIYLGAKGFSEIYWLLIAPIGFYLGVIIIHCLIYKENRDYEKSHK